MRLNQLNSFEAAHNYISETKVQPKGTGRYKLEHDNKRAQSTSALTNSLCRLINHEEFLDAHGGINHQVLEHLETVLEDAKNINAFNDKIRSQQAERSGPKLFLRKIFKTRTLTEDQIIEKIKKSYEKGINNAIKDILRKSKKHNNAQINTARLLLELNKEILEKIENRNEEEPHQAIPPSLSHSHKESSTTSHEEKSRSRSRSESEHEEIPSPTTMPDEPAAKTPPPPAPPPPPPPTYGRKNVTFSETKTTKEEKPVEKPRVGRPLPTPPPKREKTLRNLFRSKRSLNLSSTAETKGPAAKAPPAPPLPNANPSKLVRKPSKRSQRKLKTETEKPKRPGANELEEQKKKLKKLERARTRRELTKDEKSMRTFLKDAVAAKRAHLKHSSSSESASDSWSE